MSYSLPVTVANREETVKRILPKVRMGVFLAFFASVAIGALLPIYTYFKFQGDFASLEVLKQQNNKGVVLTDRENKPFFTFYSPKQESDLPLSEIPLQTRQAVVSAEDKDFYSHNGFSPKSMIRAALTDFFQKDYHYGASTITQQLAKNSVLNDKKSLSRKFQEVVLAAEIDRRYSKDQILEAYLNSVYFGRGAYGIEEAAEDYFGKKASDLNLGESAYLVALLPAPSRLSQNINEAKKLQKNILQKMVEQKYITKDQAQNASSKQIVLVPQKSDLNIYAPHFAVMVRDELIKEYGLENVENSGFRVKTSLNLEWQKKAEEEVRKQVDNLRRDNVSNGAMVAIDPKTGEILAMVGSYDWFTPNFGTVNVVLSKRSPGSSFKPIVYLRAFEKGLITPATVLMDAPTRFANFDENTFFANFPTRSAALQNLASDPNAYYQPVNYDRRFRGPVTVRRALANSLNVPSVAVMKKVGVTDAVDFAKQMGITTLGDPSSYGLSLVLGSAEVRLLDMTNFYATLANHGAQNDPTSILEIDDKYGNVVYQYRPNTKQAVDPSDAFLITSILSDNNARREEFGNLLTINRPAAVKTGTAEDFRDSWTLGYTPSLSIGVWVGNNSGQPMDNVAGSLGAAPIWKVLMEEFLKNTPKEDFPVPDGVVKSNSCLPPKEATSFANIGGEYFIKGTEPTCKVAPQIQQIPLILTEKNGTKRD